MNHSRELLTNLRNPDNSYAGRYANQAAAEIERYETALRRIRSLEEKNVPKYAQQIAAEALKD